MEITQAMGKVCDGAKNFFKTRSVGFYLTMSAVVLSLIQLIIYAIAFNAELYVQYFSTAAVIWSVLAMVLGIALSCTKWTEQWAPAAVAVCELMAFLFFIKDGYWYFTTQFYAGISMQAIVTTYYGYLWSIGLFVVILLLSVASVYIRQSKKRESKNSKEEGVAA